MYVIPTLMKKKRTELGMSQRKFSEYIGVNVNTVSFYELNKAVPKEEMYPMLAKLLDIPVRDIERMCLEERTKRRMNNA